MSKDNLKLWGSVEKTDPLMTTKVKQRGGFTAIDPMYQAHRATDVFGCYGKGWGLSESNIDFSQVELTRLAIHKAKFFYVLDGEKSEFVIHNAIEIISAKGYTDVDFAKKLETNTISKALSKLGFSADVFLGKFDDGSYVDFRNFEESINKAENRTLEINKKTEEFNQWCRDEIKAYPSLNNISTLTLVYAGHVEKLTGRCKLLGLDLTKYKKQFIEACDVQKTKIEGK